MSFEELNDDEWAMIAPFVCDEPPIRINRRGRPRAEPRVVANAVLWILSTGESWSRLPARYPSGPTCRRRFDEWHASGTLVEIVQRLTQTGRSFIYVPEPPQPAAQAVAVAVAAEEPAEDDGLPAVYWKSPESWQAPGSLAGARQADPIERMTQQLSRVDVPPVPAIAQAKMSAAPARFSASAPLPVRRDDATVVRSAPLANDVALQTQAAEWHGYLMQVVVQPVRNRMYRAAVEILKDEQRVERSGLIGPPFQDRDAARHFAFEWAREWIDRECRRAAPAQNGPGNALPAAATVTRAGGTVVTRPVPVPVNTRLVPMQRYTVSSAPLPGNDSREASASAKAGTKVSAGNAVERRAVEAPVRAHARSHAR